jgi:Permease MlaE
LSRLDFLVGWSHEFSFPGHLGPGSDCLARILRTPLVRKAPLGRDVAAIRQDRPAGDRHHSGGERCSRSLCPLARGILFQPIRRKNLDRIGNSFGSRSTIGGRLGTAFTVEIGSMQLSEQVAALRLMGVDPVRYLGFPRVAASLIAVPLFTVFSFFVAIFSSWFLMALFWDLSWPLFFQNAFQFVGPKTVSNAMLRSLLIGFTVALNAVALGLFPGSGAEDLGRAATRSIVVNLFSVLLIDLFVGMLTTVVSLGSPP